MPKSKAFLLTNWNMNHELSLESGEAVYCLVAAKENHGTTYEPQRPAAKTGIMEVSFAAKIIHDLHWPQ